MAEAHICDRCLRTFQTPEILVRHRAQPRPCTSPVAAVSHVVTDQRAAVRRDARQARNILSHVGVTGPSALGCVAAVLYLRELERLEPALARADECDVLNAPPEVQARAGRQSFSALASAAFDASEFRNYADDVRYAFLAIRHNPRGRVIACCFDDDPWRIFPLRDSRAAYDLLQLARSALSFTQGADVVIQMLLQVIVRFPHDLGLYQAPQAVVRAAIVAATAPAAQGAPPRELGTVLDPTCGTGRYLVAAHRAGAASVTGVEISEAIHVLGALRVMQALGRVPDRMVRRDFLYDSFDHILRADTVLAGLPLGIRGVTYADVVGAHGDGSAIYPLKSTLTGLIVQRIVHSLHIGGRAAIVVPIGREFASKGLKNTRFRRALFCAVAVRTVVDIPAEVHHTGCTRMVLLVFDKIRELHDCVPADDIAWPDPAVGAVLFQRLTAGAPEPYPGVGEPVPVMIIAARNWVLVPDEYAHV